MQRQDLPSTASAKGPEEDRARAASAGAGPQTDAGGWRRTRSPGVVYVGANRGANVPPGGDFARAGVGCWATQQHQHQHRAAVLPGPYVHPLAAIPAVQGPQNAAFSVPPPCFMLRTASQGQLSDSSLYTESILARQLQGPRIFSQQDQQQQRHLQRTQSEGQLHLQKDLMQQDQSKSIQQLRFFEQQMQQNRLIQNTILPQLQQLQQQQQQQQQQPQAQSQQFMPQVPQNQQQHYLYHQHNHHHHHLLHQHQQQQQQQQQHHQHQHQLLQHQHQLLQQRQNIQNFYQQPQAQIQSHFLQPPSPPPQQRFQLYHENQRQRVELISSTPDPPATPTNMTHDQDPAEQVHPSSSPSPPARVRLRFLLAKIQEYEKRALSLYYLDEPLQPSETSNQLSPSSLLQPQSSTSAIVDLDSNIEVDVDGEKEENTASIIDLTALSDTISPQFHPVSSHHQQHLSPFIKSNPYFEEKGNANKKAGDVNVKEEKENLFVDLTVPSDFTSPAIQTLRPHQEKQSSHDSVKGKSDKTAAADTFKKKTTLANAASSSDKQKALPPQRLKQPTIEASFLASREQKATKLLGAVGNNEHRRDGALFSTVAYSDDSSDAKKPDLGNVVYSSPPRASKYVDTDLIPKKELRRATIAVVINTRKAEKYINPRVSKDDASCDANTLLHQTGEKALPPAAEPQVKRDKPKTLPAPESSLSKPTNQLATLNSDNVKNPKKEKVAQTTSKKETPGSAEQKSSQKKKKTQKAASHSSSASSALSKPLKRLHGDAEDSSCRDQSLEPNKKHRASSDSDIDEKEEHSSGNDLVKLTKLMRKNSKDLELQTWRTGMRIDFAEVLQLSESKETYTLKLPRIYETLAWFEKLQVFVADCNSGDLARISKNVIAKFEDYLRHVTKQERAKRRAKAGPKAPRKTSILAPQAGSNEPVRIVVREMLRDRFFEETQESAQTQVEQMQQHTVPSTQYRTWEPSVTLSSLLKVHSKLKARAHADPSARQIQSACDDQSLLIGRRLRIEVARSLRRAYYNTCVAGSVNTIRLAPSSASCTRAPRLAFCSTPDIGTQMPVSHTSRFSCRRSNLGVLDLRANKVENLFVHAQVAVNNVVDMSPVTDVAMLQGGLLASSDYDGKVIFSRLCYASSKFKNQKSSVRSSKFHGLSPVVFNGHDTAINVLQVCPYNHRVLASGCQNGNVFIHKVPENTECENEDDQDDDNEVDVTGDLDDTIKAKLARAQPSESKIDSADDEEDNLERYYCRKARGKSSKSRVGWTWDMMVQDYETDPLSFGLEKDSCGKIEHTGFLSASKSGVADFAFGQYSTAGKLFAATVSDGDFNLPNWKSQAYTVRPSLMIWDLEVPKKTIRKIVCAESVSSIALSQDGGLLAYGTVWSAPDDPRERARVPEPQCLLHIMNAYNLTSCKKIYTGQDDVNEVGFGPCGNLVYSAGVNRTCVVFDMRREDKPYMILRHGQGLNNDDEGITCTRWLKESNLLVTGGSDGVVNVWDPVSPLPSTSQARASKTFCTLDDGWETLKGEAAGNTPTTTVRPVLSIDVAQAVRRIVFTEDESALVAAHGESLSVFTPRKSEYSWRG